MPGMTESPVWSLWLIWAGPPNTGVSSTGAGAAAALGLRFGSGAGSPSLAPEAASGSAAGAATGVSTPVSLLVSLSSAAADLCATAGTTTIILRAMIDFRVDLMAGASIE